MQHVIITGGSSGIGEAFARAYLKRGARVTIIGRSSERLEAASRRLASPNIQGFPADVADSTGLSAAIAAAQQTFGPCNRLIACAGMVRPGRFEDLSQADLRTHLDTNVTGTWNAIRCVYDGMRARRSGRILIVSSGAALIGIYGYTAYSASKFALVGLGESLQAEAVRHGITVSICYPPDTDTPQLAEENRLKPPETKALSRMGGLWSADRVAQRTLPAFERGRFNIYLGLGITALGWFGGLVRPILRRFAGRT